MLCGAVQPFWWAHGSHLILHCHGLQKRSFFVRMLRRFCLIIGLALFVLGIDLHPAEAIKAGHAVIEGFDALSKGKGSGFSLGADGTLVAGPSVGASIDLGAEQAWSIYRRPDHALFIGTAPDGRLLEVTDAGAVKTVAKVKEPAIYAVAGSADGLNVFFASSPDGKIYRMNPSGDPEVWFDPHEKYIWALLVTPEGTLYAATGIHGKLYRITAKGVGQVWYSSTDSHLRALALGDDGGILAGSANSGLLYKITAREQAVVIASSGRQEINQIAVDSTGTIYFTANGLSKPITPDKPPLANMFDAAHALGAKPSPAGDVPDDPIQDGSTLAKLGKNPREAGPNNFSPRVLWYGVTTVHSLMWTGGHAWVTTGTKGYAYMVSPEGDTAFSQINDSSVTAAIPIDEHNFVMVTSNPARLLRVSDTPASGSALYDSDVIDAKAFARWQRLSVDGIHLEGVQVSIRSGHTPSPDKTWFPWQPIALTASPDSEVTGAYSASGSRFAQLEFKISSPASISKIDLAYLPLNHSPSIRSIDFLPPGIRYVQNILPDPQIPPKTPDQITDADGDFLLHPADSPTVRWVPEVVRGFRSLTWMAYDPDQDDLTYSLAYRAVSSDAWHELASGLADPIYSFDTAGWPDGRYEIKVSASDEKENPLGEGLHDELINRNFIVNNTPPTIIVDAPLDGKVHVEVRDALSILSSVSISSNGRDYQRLFPSDSVLDSTKEEFSIPIKPGETRYIRAQDAAGNVAGKQIGG